MSIMCFHDERCQVFNAMMTALSLLRLNRKEPPMTGASGLATLLDKDTA